MVRNPQRTREPPHFLTENRRHWPIGLIYDNHTTLATSRLGASTSARSQAVPLRLILHLASPPTEKLLLAPSAEACKQAFMGQLKEADFLRWGNTKRMTGLRKAEQDGMWEGIKERSFFFLFFFHLIFLSFFPAPLSEAERAHVYIVC